MWLAVDDRTRHHYLTRRELFVDNHFQVVALGLHKPLDEAREEVRAACTLGWPARQGDVGVRPVSAHQVGNAEQVYHNRQIDGLAESREDVFQRHLNKCEGFGAVPELRDVLLNAILAPSKK